MYRNELNPESHLLSNTNTNESTDLDQVRIIYININHTTHASLCVIVSKIAIISVYMLTSSKDTSFTLETRNFTS